MRGPAPEDLTGRRYGALVVQSIYSRPRPKWLCQCDCGNTTIADATNLKAGRTKSCGCQQNTGAGSRTHGHAAVKNASPTYKTWSGIKRRCLNPNESSFKRYGGRGITICDKWRDSFEAFLADVGEKPGPEYSIDRIDPNGHYEPGNVRWATITTQARNTRAVRLSESKVETIRSLAASGRTLRSLAREFGVSQRTIQFVVRGVTWK